MDFLKEPWEHQKKAVAASFQHRNLALLFEPGTGKTFCAINFLRGRYAQNGRVLRTLILCPPVVIPNWKQEFGMYSRIPQGEILALTGTGGKRVKALKDFLYDQKEMNYSRNRIVISNYEALQNKELYEILSSWGPEALVCDESHNLKDPQGKRAKLVFQLSQNCMHRYLLTGTPILNTLMDVFMQYKILDQGDTFGKNFFVFRDRYFEDTNARWRGNQNYFPKWFPRKEMMQDLQGRLYRTGLRAVKSECLDLPPLVKTQRFVELNPEQKRMYKEMKDDFLTYVDTLTEQGEKPVVIAQLAMTKALRLQQIVTGFAKDEEGAHHQLEDVPRMKVLEECLHDIAVNQEEKVIVWSVFKENYRQIEAVCKKLKLKYTELHGGISSTKKQENIEAFRKDPEVKVLIANQAAGGVGLNLVEASYMIYYSRGFQLGHDLQSEARNYRGGSEIHDKITRIDLVALGTIDELIDEALKQKINLAEKILDWKERI